MRTPLRPLGPLAAGHSPDGESPSLARAAVAASERNRLIHRMLSEALSRRDLQMVSRLLGELGLRKTEIRTARQLAKAGDLLLRLDLEDLDQPPNLAEPLRSALRAVALPQAPTPTPMGLLASLRPASVLLLEVLSIRHRQGQIEGLLTAVHLLGEILPLLAWEDVLGHGGDPTQLLKIVSQPDSLWGTECCPTRGPGRRAASGLSTAVRSTGSWQLYLQRSFSLLGMQLSECADCHLSCRMARLAGPRGSRLSTRLRVAALLSRSDLLGERHGSVVGHAFAVPTLPEVDAAWGRTRRQLVLLVPAAGEADDHPFPGLREVICAVAGNALPDRSVLSDILSELKRELEVLLTVHGGNR